MHLTQWLVTSNWTVFSWNIPYLPGILYILSKKWQWSGIYMGRWASCTNVKSLRRIWCWAWYDKEAWSCVIEARVCVNNYVCFTSCLVWHWCNGHRNYKEIRVHPVGTRSRFDCNNLGTNVWCYELPYTCNVKWMRCILMFKQRPPPQRQPKTKTVIFLDSNCPWYGNSKTHY